MEQMEFDELGDGVRSEDIERLSLEQEIEIKKAELEALLNEQHRNGSTQWLNSRWALEDNDWVIRLTSSRLF